MIALRALQTAAALAALDLATGKVTVDQLILAVALGYELGRRVQTALGDYDAVNEQGWHSTGVCGTFASAIAASRILGLNQTQITVALSGHVTLAEIVRERRTRPEVTAMMDRIKLGLD